VLLCFLIFTRVLTFFSAVVGAVWTENIDWTNIDCRTWPRGSAIGERLWSHKENWKDDIADVFNRLKINSARLRERGIQAADPVLGGHDHSSQCRKFPQNIQRPVGNPQDNVRDVTVLQMNIDEGGGSPARVESVLDWLKKQYADVIGFCELNGWDRTVAGDVASYMEVHASHIGFPNSYLFKTQSPYYLGIMSIFPINILYVNDNPDDFERGMIHAKIKDVNYIVVHLNAHDSEKREAEVALVLKIALAVGNEPVLIMGDLNTLSPLDQSWHKEEGILENLSVRAPTDRLRKKFTKSSPDGAAELNYRPMQMFLDGGFTDLCVWSSALNDDRHQRCRYTEPTQLSGQEEHLKIRVDFMLANDAFLRRSPSSEVLHNEITGQLSDHYPIRTKWVGDAV
jgi:endonuclease/exonuclease/phosphatase family metal-dependent hydrolase